MKVEEENAEKEYVRLHGNIVFENVTIKAGEKEIIRNINLEIN